MIIEKIIYRDTKNLETGVEIIFFLKSDEQSILVFNQSDFYLVNKSTKSDFSRFMLFDYKSNFELEISGIKEIYDKNFKHFITFTNGDLMIIDFKFDTFYEREVQNFQILKHETLKLNRNDKLDKLNDLKETNILDLRFLPEI